LTQVLSAATLYPVVQQLEQLDLANTSLTILPSLQLPRLLQLNMSHNMLTFLPSSSLGRVGRGHTIQK
jgi:Leucine-rich repeat (LRR) protein